MPRARNIPYSGDWPADLVHFQELGTLSENPVSLILEAPLRMLRFILISALTTTSAWATSCGNSSAVKAWWQGADAVFVGNVERVERLVTKGFDGEEYTDAEIVVVRVGEPFKGVQSAQALRVVHSLAAGYPSWNPDQHLLFYIFRDAQGNWTNPICGKTRETQDAVDDLAFLRALPGSALRTRIAGVVSVYDLHGVKRVQGVAGAKITLSAGDTQFHASTNAEGLYEIYDVPAGNYRVDTAPPQGWRIAGSDAVGAYLNREHDSITVPENVSASLNFDAHVDNHIFGHVYDPHRQPMKDVCVHLLPLVPLDNSDDSSAGGCTDAEGAFELRDMPAGEYWLVSNRSNIPTGSHPFPATYYPGVAQKQQASLIRIGFGETLHNIDLKLPSIVDRSAIKGRVVFQDGVPAAGEYVIFSTGDFHGEVATTDADGRFEMQLLAGERGTLSARFEYNRVDETCAAYDKLMEEEHLWLTLYSNKTLLTTKKEGATFELTFPYPSCEAHIKTQNTRLVTSPRR